MSGVFDPAPAAATLAEAWHSGALLTEFGARMERYIAELKSVPLAQGLVLPPDTLADLQKLADELGLRQQLPLVPA